MTIKIKRLNDAVHMQATNEHGASLHMDGIESIGGVNGGLTPMELLLAAAGGCSAIDVITILKKQRQNPDDVQVEVSGDRVSVEGTQYTEYRTIHLHFTLKGAQLDENKVARAIDLSLNKYCSVSKTLEKTAKITSSFELVS